MPLLLDTGLSSLVRRRDNGQEACAVELPRSVAEPNQVAILVLADGLPGRPDPERAAHAAVDALMTGWRAAPETWGPAKRLQECFAAANQGLLTADSRGLAASLSALVLRPRRWLIGHAGDTRVWLYRNHQIRLLTRDHRIPSFQPTPQFGKALGLAPALEADITTGELQEGDVFLLTSSGVHETLDSATLLSGLMGDAPAQQMAEALTRRAQTTAKVGGLHACVVRVERLPVETAATVSDEPATLAMISPPVIGDRVDGWRIEELVQKSSRFRLYRAAGADGRNVLLKFPNPHFGDDAAFVDEFLREEWIARRLESPHIVRALPLAKGQRSALYTVLAYAPGENLSDRIKRKRGLHANEALPLAKQLLETLDLLRRAGVNHPDIRPKNLAFDKPNARLALLNAGASMLHRRREAENAQQASSSALSYLAPELLEGRDAGERSDVYTAGAVLYRMLTGKYPYGKIKSLNHAAFGALDPEACATAGAPAWLCDILGRACAFDPNARYANVAAFLRALTDGEKRATVQAQAAASTPAAPTASAPSRKLREWIIVAALGIGLLVYILLAIF
jgi:protein phosphatase